MDLSNIGNLMRKAQASIGEKSYLFKNTDLVVDVSMTVFLLYQHTWFWVEFALMELSDVV